MKGHNVGKYIVSLYRKGDKHIIAVMDRIEYLWLKQNCCLKAGSPARDEIISLFNGLRADIHLRRYKSPIPQGMLDKPYKSLRDVLTGISKSRKPMNNSVNLDKPMPKKMNIHLDQLRVMVKAELALREPEQIKSMDISALKELDFYLAKA